jgi:hypothetical protein
MMGTKPWTKEIIENLEAGLNLKHPLIISNETKDLIESRLLQQEFSESLH